MKSERSKQLSFRLLILRIVDILILVAPLLSYFIVGLSEGDIVYKKVALVGMVVIALVLVIINMLFKFKLRSPIWIIVLGCYIAVDNIIPLLVCISIATILDEFVLTPVIKKTKVQYISNREIDKREELKNE